MKSYSLAVLLLFSILPVFSQDKPELKLGGALRMQYKYQDWNADNRNQYGSLAYDVFRLNVDGKYKRLSLHAEYRLYAKSSGGGMLKSGWVGYDFSEHHNLKLGLTTVPFGLLPYQSNSFFFNVNYYIGLEDDDDFGIDYQYTDKHWTLNAAFFKNSDLYNGDGSEMSCDRYSYDVVGDNKETNTLALRAVNKGGTDLKYEAGCSVMVGQLYNLTSKKMGNRWAGAIHARLDYQRWQLKTQYTHYEMSPDVKASTVSMGAFAAPYEVAAEGDTYSLCLSYTLPIEKGIVNSLVFYNDFSMLDKTDKSFNDTYENVVGCSLTMGPVVTIVDCAWGKNHAWLGPNYDTAFGAGDNKKGWNTRFNINVGYYF